MSRESFKISLVLIASGWAFVALVAVLRHYDFKTDELAANVKIKKLEILEKYGLETVEQYQRLMNEHRAETNPNAAKRKPSL